MLLLNASFVSVQPNRHYLLTSFSGFWIVNATRHACTVAGAEEKHDDLQAALKSAQRAARKAASRLESAAIDREKHRHVKHASKSER